MIYTKKGDKGYTRLFNGAKVSKSDLRVKALGAIDELNSFCGAIASFSQLDAKTIIVRDMLFKIQNDLFIIQACLAGSDPAKLKLDNRNVKWLEQNIDKMTSKMPELNKFIIPGGNNAAIFSHISRSICRRAEREIVIFSESKKVSKNILKYINRLSDFFFTLARYINYKSNYQEVNPKY
ncbi:MAG: cob(I)yrinic acid a,c-diamide adenosyltransferase [Patescibacteria group bacterium]